MEHRHDAHSPAGPSRIQIGPTRRHRMGTVPGIPTLGPPCRRRRSALGTWPLCDQGQSTLRGKANAAPTSGGPHTRSCPVFFKSASVTGSMATGSKPTRPAASSCCPVMPGTSTGQVRRVHHAGIGHWSLGSRIPGSRRRSAAARPHIIKRSITGLTDARRCTMGGFRIAVSTNQLSAEERIALESVQRV